jgi:hypothetical protein
MPTLERPVRKQEQLALRRGTRCSCHHVVHDSSPSAHRSHMRERSQSPRAMTRLLPSGDQSSQFLSPDSHLLPFFRGCNKTSNDGQVHHLLRFAHQQCLCVAFFELARGTRVGGIRFHPQSPDTRGLFRDTDLKRVLSIRLAPRLSVVGV